MEENILRINQLTKCYDGFSLGQINLELPCGYIMGIVGENGAGKSTMIKTILGLIHADGGTVEIFGRECRMQEEEIREDIGVVFGELNLPTTFTSTEICGMMSRIYRNWDSEQYYRYLEQFHIEKKKKLKQYSTGMKVKAALAIALSHNARLLILDEPTSGLDPVVREEVMDILREFVMEEKNSVLISTHIISDLEKTADYVVFLHEGSIVLQGEKDQILAEYKIMKGSRLEIEKLREEDSLEIVALRNSEFGAEALVKHTKLRPGRTNLVLEAASLEQIMIFIVKGDQL